MDADNEYVGTADHIISDTLLIKYWNTKTGYIKCFEDKR